MQRPAVLATAILGVLATASVAHAQRAGSRVGPSPAQIPETGGASKEDLARIAMYRYAECVVSNSRVRVELYLETFPGSKVAQKMANSLSVDDCLSTGELHISEPLFRSGVYDVLYRRKFQKEGPLDFSAVPVIDYAAGSDLESQSDAPSRIALRQIADCTVRKAPETSRVLVLSMVASKAERVAFTQLVPSMAPCVLEGSKLSFSRSTFRGVIGEALYRLSAGAGQPTVAVKD